MNNKFLLLVALLFYSSQTMYHEHCNTMQDNYYNAEFDENDPISIKITVILKKRILLKNKTIELLLKEGETVASVLEHTVDLKYGRKKLSQDFSLLPYNTELDIPFTYEFNHSVDDDMRYPIAFYKTTTFLLQKKYKGPGARKN